MGRGMWVDLAELERFIEQLRQFDSELADSVSNLSSHFSQLGTVWQDDKYQQFADQWETAVSSMKKYLDESPQHIQFLRRKAEAVSDYLR